MYWIRGQIIITNCLPSQYQGNKMDTTDKIIKYENNELSAAQELELFAELIESGLCWQLQGFYGRAAKAYIENGIISEEGKIL